jgi:hypothetical protein
MRIAKTKEVEEERKRGMKAHIFRSATFARNTNIRRDYLNEAVEDFLAKGGTIKKLKTPKFVRECNPYNTSVSHILADFDLMGDL